MAKISAKEVVQDIRSGMDDTGLMQKYGISAQGLRVLFRKLLDRGAVTREDLDDRTPASDTTIRLAWRCPACGTPQPKEVDECPDCGIIVAEFLEKQEQKDRPQPTIAPPSSRISNQATGGASMLWTTSFIWWTCPSCGSQNNNNEGVCSHCGLVLPLWREFS